MDLYLRVYFINGLLLKKMKKLKIFLHEKHFTKLSPIFAFGYKNNPLLNGFSCKYKSHQMFRIKTIQSLVYVFSFFNSVLMILKPLIFFIQQFHRDNKIA